MTGGDLPTLPPVALFVGFEITTMKESGQLERIIIGEGPTAGKPISAVRIGEPSKELPFCAIPSIRWRDNGHTFVLETWFNGEWLEVPLVSTLPPLPNKELTD